MATSFSLPDARRIRGYFLRIPIATRVQLAIVTAFYCLHLIWPAVDQWGALVPQDINLLTLSKLNTFPLLHRSIFHFLLNVTALLPLLERFEAEHGTLMTLILFNGCFGYLPGGLYTLLELFVFRQNTPVVGASVWVCLLLGFEAIKTYKQNPNLTISGYSIPTWTTPLILVLVISFLLPNVSLLGHMCGLLVGYLWGLGWLRYLAPSERILRWIEEKLNLLGRIPNYVSVDQKIFGRYGVLPSTSGRSPRVGPGRGGLGDSNAVPLGLVGSTQRLGP